MLYGQGGDAQGGTHGVGRPQGVLLCLPQPTRIYHLALRNC
jgi:hypothetical protein